MKSIGRILYSPSSHLLPSNNWAIVSCDDEIARYYRYLYMKEFPLKKLVKPLWGAHISWLRNEAMSNNQVWRQSNQQVIEYEYDVNVKTNGKFYWLDVSCDYLLDLRSQYGLVRRPKYGLHLTIGRSAS